MFSLKLPDPSSTADLSARGAHIPASPSVASVQYLERVEPEAFYRDYVALRRPAIIAGAADWPATKKWSIDWFANRFGDREVVVERKLLRMDEFLRKVEASTPVDPAPYLNGISIADNFPELLPDLTPAPAITQPNWLASAHMPARWKTRDGFLELLVGGYGTRFPGLHYDQWYLNAFVTQIVGDKDFYLFRPEDTRYLYPREDAPSRSCIRNIHDVNLSEYPQFGHARPIHVRLRQGETIFVPWGWWHVTELPGTSIAVSINSANGANWDAFSEDFSMRSRLPRRALIKLALRGVALMERHRTH